MKVEKSSGELSQISWLLSTYLSANSNFHASWRISLRMPLPCSDFFSDLQLLSRTESKLMRLVSKVSLVFLHSAFTSYGQPYLSPPVYVGSNLLFAGSGTQPVIPHLFSFADFFLLAYTFLSSYFHSSSLFINCWEPNIFQKLPTSQNCPQLLKSINGNLIFIYFLQYLVLPYL